MIEWRIIRDFDDDTFIIKINKEKRNVYKLSYTSDEDLIDCIIYYRKEMKDTIDFTVYHEYCYELSLITEHMKKRLMPLVYRKEEMLNFMKM